MRENIMLQLVCGGFDVVVFPMMWHRTFVSKYSWDNVTREGESMFGNTCGISRGDL